MATAILHMEGARSKRRKYLGAPLCSSSGVATNSMWVCQQDNYHAFRKFAARGNGRKHAVKANLASAARHAADGKLRAEGRVRRRSRTCACCARVPEPAVSRGVERFAEPHVSGRFVTDEFQKGMMAQAGHYVREELDELCVHRDL